MARLGALCADPGLLDTLRAIPAMDDQTPTPAPPTDAVRPDLRARLATLRRNPAVRRAVLGLLAVFMVLLAATVLERIVYSGRVMPGVEMAGVDLGGKSEQDAYDELVEVANRIETEPLRARADGQTLSAEPSEFGLDVDVETALAEARRAGRSGNPLASIASTIGRLAGTKSVPLPIEIDDDAIDTVLNRWQASIDEGAIDGTLRFEGTEVKVVASRSGRAIELDAARRIVRDALGLVDRRAVDIPVEVRRSPVSADMLEAAATRARRVLSTSYRVTRGGQTLTITPEKLAPAMGTKLRDGSLTLRIDPGILGASLGLELLRIVTPATDATFAVTPANTVEVVPSRNGAQLDMPKVIKAILAGRRSFAAPMRVLRPEHDTKWAKALGIEEQISTFTTYYPPGQPRVTNIHRGADLLNNTVVEPGETFSLNDTIGPRTAERGFVSAPVYYEGFTEDFGGGVSQLATTTYNNVFWAGLEDVYHKPHSVYFTRYPMGREATVNYGTVDLKFRNDYPTGVLVRAAYTDQSITVTFYGRKDGRVVKEASGDCTSTDPASRCLEVVEELPIERKEITCPPPGEVDTRNDPEGRCAELGPGQTLTISDGHTGYRVRLDRIIERPGEDPDRRTYTWNYVMDPNTVLVGYRETPPSTTTTSGPPASTTTTAATTTST